MLKQLVDELEKRQQRAIVFLGYADVLSLLRNHNYQFIVLVQTSILETLIRYIKKRDRVLFFCNLPPFRKQRRSILYFHNQNILMPSRFTAQDISFLKEGKNRIYKVWLRWFHRNVDLVACQTLSVRNQLNKLGADAALLPFYNEVKPLTEDKKYDFCYVSSFAPHKNHNNLIKAVRILLKERHFTVALTVDDSEKNRLLIREINELNLHFGRQCICNMGRLSKEQVNKLYSQTGALIFPSFTETFGLPVIEAVQCNLPVLISDRPYAYDLLENPIVFNPENPESIAEQMRLFLNGSYINTIQSLKIDNKINELIELLIA